MTKLNNLETGFMSFIQGKVINGLWSLTSGAALFRRDLGKECFYRALEEALREQHDWRGGWGLPCKASRSCFLGQWLRW